MKNENTETKLESSTSSGAATCSAFNLNGAFINSTCDHGHHTSVGCRGKGNQPPNCLRDDRKMKNGSVTCIAYRGG